MIIKLIIFISLLVTNIQLLFAEYIDLEVYLSTEYKGSIYLSVDGKDKGTIPTLISNLPVGYHYFKIRWLDDKGNYCDIKEKIMITSKDVRLYLSKMKKYTLWGPFSYGLVSVGVFWAIVSIFTSF